jgi:hypothetical protein
MAVGHDFAGEISQAIDESPREYLNRCELEAASAPRNAEAV